MRDKIPVKTSLFSPLALAACALGLTACHNQAQQQKATAAKPGVAVGMSVSDGRLVLPAVPGNPGAVYFTVHNDTGDKATLMAAKVDGAQSAMLHQMNMVDGHTDMQEVMQMDVPAGGELEFAPAGKHVMAMHLADSLKPGGTTNVTLSFAGGAETTFPAEILAAGDAH
jgi:copper(I)-binding protein